MAQASDIRPHMEVRDSDGVHVGTVDHLDGDRIKLARTDSADGEHHYVALSQVARVDTHVHLATTGAALGLLGLGVAGAATAGDRGAAYPAGTTRVDETRTRSKPIWPWIAALAALLLLFLLFRGCTPHREADTVATTTTTNAAPATAPLPVEAVALPNGQSVNLTPQSLNYELQRYLASTAPTPRTFTFDKLNFDTGSAAIRPDDQPHVDALAQILGAYPKAKVTITGYTDTQGAAPGNAQLGQQRADAVAAALAAKGVAKDRVTTSSGGESNPKDTNATAGGRFDNRRSELTVTAK